MLVLTRKQDQQIQVGNDIKVTILRVKGNTVRIGIEAPEGVRILRGELQAFETEVSEENFPVAARLPAKAPRVKISNKSSEIRSPLGDRVRNRSAAAVATGPIATPAEWFATM